MDSFSFLDMKTYFLALLPLLSCTAAHAQEKHDYHWVFGYGPSDPALHYGGTLINFNTSPPSLAYFETPDGFYWDKATLSDKHGNLVAYTNGCRILNSAHQPMENGLDINEGPIHTQYCDDLVSFYPNEQGTLFLLMPGSDSLYVLFHLRMWPGIIVKDWLYSVIDVSANEGLGRVTLKNEPLRTDTFTDMITACRHANGRDWWIVVQENHRFVDLPPDGKAKYHFYLLDPYGIHYQGEQQIGRLFSFTSTVGQSCFSPDGSRFAIGNIYNGVNFFDFDRCTGLLSNPGHLDLQADSVVAMGLAFSPNSRFLYATTGLWLLQYDMKAPDVGASKVNVAEYDGFISQLPTTFYQLALAPNGKIYGSSHFGTDVLHIIHQPDELGLDCQVEQHGLKLPAYHAYTMPNTPHYRLYDVPGSVCDSLGVNTPSSTAEIDGDISYLWVYPNPSTGWVTITNPNAAERAIQVQDISGHLVYQAQTQAADFDLSHLQNGVYFVRAWELASGRSQIAKLVIAH
jgi:hypothetical protein